MRRQARRLTLSRGRRLVHIQRPSFGCGGVDVACPRSCCALEVGGCSDNPISDFGDDGKFCHHHSEGTAQSGINRHQRRADWCPNDQKTFACEWAVSQTTDKKAGFLSLSLWCSSNVSHTSPTLTLCFQWSKQHQCPFPCH